MDGEASGMKSESTLYHELDDLKGDQANTCDG